MEQDIGVIFMGANDFLRNPPEDLADIVPMIIEGTQCKKPSSKKDCMMLWVHRYIIGM